MEINDPQNTGKFIKLSSFVPGRKDPRDKPGWFEPKWGKRPLKGLIGIQNHDPGDVVEFRDVSVR